MILAICDDKKIIRDYLSDIGLKYGRENNVDVELIQFSSGEEVLDYDGFIDLLLLDIKLSGMNGIEVKDRINKKENIDYIIFVSGVINQVWKCFGKKTIGFMQKPVLYRDFCEKMVEYKKAKDAGIIIEIATENGISFIKAEKIIYIRAQNVYSEIITEKSTYLVRESLSEYENKLGKGTFYRIHKSYLINMDYIKSIDGYIAILEMGNKLKIGRTKLKDLKNLYRDYCRRNAY